MEVIVDGVQYIPKQDDPLRIPRSVNADDVKITTVTVVPSEEQVEMAVRLASWIRWSTPSVFYDALREAL